MSNDDHSFKIKPWPVLRNVVVDLMVAGMPKHNVHGLSEVDVTKARKLIKDYEIKTGIKLSFTSFFLHCLGKAVGNNKIMHAIRKKNDLVLFDNVDIATIVEKVVDGRIFPTSYIVRSANKKTFMQIHEEIRQTQEEKKENPDMPKLMKLLALPQWIRLLFWRYMRKHPVKKKEVSGTVGLTAIGMFAKGIAWALPVTPATLTITLGGIYEKVVPYKGEICIREHLCYTATIDHDIVDGGPSTRFLMELVDLIENAKCLEEL